MSNSNGQDSPRYETGADFWRDTAVSYGTTEALGICGRYLDTQLKHELPRDEHQFCRELFTAMYEVAAKTADPAKLVYPYDFQMGITRKWSTRPRETVHSTAKIGPAKREGGPMNKVREYS